MSGLDLQSELAIRDRRMPIVFITAFPEDRIRKRAEDGGAVGFFSKPVDPHALILCLDTILKCT
jgi:FixJ family two-component response regulator